MDNKSRKPIQTQSENFQIEQRGWVQLQSLQKVLVQKRDLASVNNSVHHGNTCKMMLPNRWTNDHGESYEYATTPKLEVRIPGRGGTDDNVPDQSLAIKSYQASSATSAMLGHTTKLQPTSHIRMWSIWTHTKGEKDKGSSPTRKCIFLGYGTDESFKFRLWNL